MSSKFSVLFVIFVSVIMLCTTLAYGKPILDDLFGGFIKNDQLANGSSRDRAVVKRRINSENPDASLKQISLQSLIGDVEDSLFETALSVGGVAQNNGDVVPEVMPNSKIKRQSEDTSNTKNEKAAVTTLSSVGVDETKNNENILLQTTQKVPAENGVPAHVLIDRVAIQQHQGGLPIIPAFQVYHSKVISATFKEPTNTKTAINIDGSSNSGGSTKISIAQTAVHAATTNVASGSPIIAIATTTTNENGNQSTIAITNESTTTTLLPTTITIGTTEIVADVTTEVTNSDQNIRKLDKKDKVTSSTDSVEITEKTERIFNSTTSEPTTQSPSTTTELTIVKLKEAEEELKEKVAEIEAEPVILTARV